MATAPSSWHRRAVVRSTARGRQRDYERLSRNEASRGSIEHAVRAAAEELAARTWVTHDTADLEAASYLEKVADRLGQCGVATAHMDRRCGSAIAIPHSCRVRLCPDCERSRAARMVGKVVEIAIEALRAVMWTLTIRNVPRGELKRSHEVIGDAYRRLRRHRVMAGARGGIYSLETTWDGRGQTWHPHLHVLMDGPWITWGDMRDAWRGATCDAWRSALRTRPSTGGRPGRLPRCPHLVDEQGRPIGGCRGSWMVWVSPLKGSPGSPEWIEGVRETIKYVSKGLLGRDGRLDPDLTPAAIAELLLALRHRRLVNGWGTFRRIKDELEDLEDGTRYHGDAAPWERGLPLVCPACGQDADWSPLTWEVARTACVPAGGVLLWRPPPLASEGSYS